MKIKYLYILLFSLVTAVATSCSHAEAPKASEPVEIKEITGIVSHYKNDVMYLKVLRTGMIHELRYTEDTKMDIVAAPRDTVLLVYTGHVGLVRELPVIREIHTRPFKGSGSNVVNLKDLKDNGVLITR